MTTALAILKILLVCAAFRSAVNANASANKKKNWQAVFAVGMFFAFALTAAFINTATFGL